MPQITSPLSTPTGMPALNSAHLGKAAGLRIHFALFSDFTAAITTGTSSYAADLWADGQEMTIASEADSGAVRVWRTALGHARTVKVGRLEVVLPANSNVVLAAAGVPVSGTGANGDLSVDKAAGIAYLKTAGAWASAGNISSLSSATAAAVEAAKDAGSNFMSGTLGPVADLATLNSTYPAASNALRSAYVTGVGFFDCDGVAWSPRKQPRKTTVAMQRLWGLGATFSNGGGSNSISQALGKESLDAGISAVRVWIFSKEPINESSGWEVIVAPTDQYLNDTTANAFYPQVGGTQYNLMAESASDHTLVANQYGWRRAQWGGQWNDGRASKSGRLRPASNFKNQHPTPNSYYAVPGVIVSDWIDIKTVPAADGRHYMLWRAKKNAAVNETMAFSSDVNAAWKNAAALPWYRRQFCMSHTSDAITTLTAVPAAPTEANFQNSPRAIAFEYRFNTPVRSVAACGDSITESGGFQSYGRNNWLIQSTLAMSTPASPVVPINLGFSTSTTPNFLGQLEQMYAMGARPTDVIIPNISFNDFSIYGGTSTGTQYLLSQCQARLVRAIEMIRSYGGRPFVTTDFHNLNLNSGTAAFDTMCSNIDTFTRGLASSGECYLIDFRSAWNTSLDDGVHPYQAGIDIMASITTAALQANQG